MCHSRRDSIKSSGESIRALDFARDLVPHGEWFGRVLPAYVALVDAEQSELRFTVTSRGSQRKSPARSNSYQ